MSLIKQFLFTMMNDETINQFLDECEPSEDEVDNYCQMIEEVKHAEN